MSTRRRLALILVLLTTSLFWLTRSGSPPVARSHPPLAADSAKDVSASRPIRPSKKSAVSPAVRIDSEEIWDLNLAGQPLAITLALDEAILRDADGKESIARLNPPATQETLPARLAERLMRGT